jgi:hypothetical protein
LTGPVGFKRYSIVLTAFLLIGLCPFLAFAVDLCQAKLLGPGSFSRNDQPIRNQCESPTCWAFAGIRYFEGKAEKQSGVKLQLSVEHLIALATIDRVLATVKGNQEWRNSWPFYPGHFAQARAFVREHGFIQEQAWKPKRSLVKNVGQVTAKLEQIRPQLELQWSELRAEHSGRVPADVEARFTAFARRKITEAVEFFTGPLPAGVIWRGRKVSLPDFARHVLPSLNGQHHAILFEFPGPTPIPQRLVRMSWNPRPDGTQGATSPVVEMGNGRHGTVLEKIRQLIDRDGVVFMSYQHSHIGVSGGAMFADPTAPALGTHAISVVDYALDANGKVGALKIQNSWGASQGARGFFFMPASLFRQCAVNVEWLE